MGIKRDNDLEVMLIRFFNMQTGLSLRVKNEANLNAVAVALSEVDYSVAKVKEHIKTWVENTDPEVIHSDDDVLFNCLASINNEVTEEEKVTDSLGILEQAVVKMIADMQTEKIEQAVMGSVEDKVRSFIKDEYGTIERKIITVVDGKKAEMEGVQHDKFETVLKFVSNNEAVFLTGPAGSGKNVLCKQIAEALGLNFYFTNAVTQEYKLTGFTDAMGTYQPTQFYKAFTNGGLFMLDEMDASIPEVLVILNAAIANRYFDFPAPIGYVEAHPDFRVIAAGNTIGHGANPEYVGRNQLDGASLDRFALVEVDYSEAIENNVANGDMELADFCRDFRNAARLAGVNVIVSYRAIGRLSKMLKLLSIEEALKTCLIKGLEKDDINSIMNCINRSSKYKDALVSIVKNM